MGRRFVHRSHSWSQSVASHSSLRRRYRRRGKVGTSTTSSAFRWTTQNPVLQPIAPLTGHATAAATAVSDNGKIVAGIFSPQLPRLSRGGPLVGMQGRPFAGRNLVPNAGIKDLKQLLVENGVNLDNIALVSVTGISPDGQWIQGTSPDTGRLTPSLHRSVLR